MQPTVTLYRLSGEVIDRGENFIALCQHNKNDLHGADLYGANLGGANLHGANLGGADLRRADLRSADLGGADLGGADLRRADLGGADLGGADLGGARLVGADLGGASLVGADLGGADLRRADLGGANLRDTRLVGADLRGTDLHGTALIDGGTERRGYRIVGHRTASGLQILAGCRHFTVDEAWHHWGAKDYRGGSAQAAEILACVGLIVRLDAAMRYTESEEKQDA